MNCARKKLRISVKKTRESFCQNTYMFFQKVVRVFRKTCTCFFENIYGRDSLEKKSWITGEITVMPLIMEN